MRRFGQAGAGDGFHSASHRERRDADLFFADLMGRHAPSRHAARFARAQRRGVDEFWAEADPTPGAVTIAPGRDADEIIVTRADGTRIHVRRKVRATLLTRPGRPRAGFCSDDDRVFLRISWCEGTQGTIDAGANPQSAFRSLIDTVVTQINRGDTPEQIKQTFENASVQPFIDLDITSVGSWKITGDLRLDVNRTGITSTAAKVSADRGWIKLGVEYKDDGTGKQVLATAEFPLSKRTVSGKKCPERELAVWWDVECLREVPTQDTLPSPGKIKKHERLLLYFDYAKDTLRRDAASGTPVPVDDVDAILRSDPRLGTARLNKRQLARLDYLVGQGYWLEAVDGYTSPEGRRTPPPPGSRSKWEGNDALATERAQKVRKLIIARYSQIMVMRPQPGMPPRMRFPEGKRMPAGTGHSEYPGPDPRVGVDLEGSALDRMLILGDARLGVKPFLDDHPEELARMTDEDRQFVTDRSHSVRKRAERLFENLRRVEIHLEHIETIKGAVVDSFYLQHDPECPSDVIEAAERTWGSRMPFTRPDPPLCDP